MNREAKFKDSGLAYLLCFIFIIGVSAILTWIISYIASAEGVQAEDVSNREWVLYLNYFLSEFVFILTFLVIILVTKNKNFKNSYKLNFKFNFKIFLSVVILGFIVMLCSLNLTNAINIGFSYISPLPLTNDVGISINNFWKFLLSVVFLALLPSLCEEIIFRGIIYNGLRKKFSLLMSVTLSSIMFMLIHLSIYKSFYQIVLGVILALLVYFTGTIFYGVIFHFANNFSIVLFNYVFGNKSIFEFTQFGVREVILSVLIFLAGFAIIFLFFKVLCSYTKKHKNYFRLEDNCNPLENYNLNENNLSYEDKLIINDKRNEGIGAFFVSIAIAIILWSFASFGGFI